MKKILAFAGSNHTTSINQQLVVFTASLIHDIEVKVLAIQDWKVPMYSIDMDPDQTPEQISELITLIQAHDAFILSSPEHNGSTPAFLKNIIDWLSRRAKKVFADKPMLLMSTSPGKGGATTNRKLLERLLPHQGANIVATFSLPSFQENLKEGEMADEQLALLKESIGKLEAAL